MDRLSKRFIKHIKNKYDGTVYYPYNPISDIAIQLNASEKELNDCIDFLEENQYVKKLNSDKKASLVGVTLTHMGNNYRYFQRQKFYKYVIDKWIDFFAMLISLSAIIISVISLLR